MAGVGIGQSLRRTLRGRLRALGFDVVRYDATRFPELRRLALIRERGVDVVLDVGANDGPFAAGLRRAGYEGRIVSFEPQSVAFARLEAAAAVDPRWECRRIALAATTGEAELHLAANSSSSSLLEMGEQHLASSPDSRYVGVENVPLARLDDLRTELMQPADHLYLKIDVQGLELDVLRGAAEALAQVVVLDVELSLVPLYTGGPPFQDVLEHVAERGFVPLWLEPAFVDPVDGRILQLDGLFGRAGVPASD